MSLFKSKSAPKSRRASGDFVVVQYCPGADPEMQVGRPWDRASALRIFTGVLTSAPDGYYAPANAASMRVVAVDDWNQSRLAAAFLES